MSNETLAGKIVKEKRIVSSMVKIYCKRHHQQNDLCDECKAVLEYAYSKIDRCPFIATKSFCSNCKVHCYQKDKREQIKEVMRYSGPLMLWYHPFIALEHVFSKWRKRE